MTTPSALADFLKSKLDSEKAEDIVLIPLTGKSNIADYMIVASGRSQRHVGALAKKLSNILTELGQKPIGVEGMTTCDWVLVDAGDVVVHLFRPEIRNYYNLEKMWDLDLPTDHDMITAQPLGKDMHPASA